MPKYVAFLRAINVGGHTVKMDYLRSLFEAIGFSNVETYIASGNVIFDAPSTDATALESAIADHLQQTLGYAVATFIRTTSELADIAHARPFSASDLNAPGHSMYIAFMAGRPDPASQQKLLSFTTEVDEFQVAGREIYWLCRKRMSESAFSGALLEKTVGMAATLRNSTTVNKIAAKYADLY